MFDRKIYQELTDQRIYEIVTRCINSQHINNLKPETIIFEGFDLGHTFYQIHKCAERISGLEDPKAFSLKYNSKGEVTKITSTAIVRLLGKLKAIRNDYHAHYFLHPYIYVFLEGMMRYELQNFSDIDSVAKTLDVQAAKFYNQFVLELHQVLKHPKLLQQINNRKKTCERNKQSCWSYTDNLFKRHAKLCIVRVDLYYNYDDKGHGVSQETALADLNVLMKCFKKHSLFEHYVGHIIKMEYGEKKGYHFHCLIFFNGNKVRKDIVIADLVGELWKEITLGVGYFNNCNKVKSDYGERCCIGMVHRKNVEKRRYLRNVISYFCKSDQFVMAKVTAKSRTLFRGQLK